MTTAGAQELELAALRASLATLTGLLEHAPVALVVTAPDGIIQYASPRITALNGFSPTELVGQPGYDYIDVRDRGRLREHLSRVRTAGSSEQTLDLRIVHKQAGSIWSQVSYRAQRDPAGRLKAYVASYRELPAQAEASVALRRDPDTAGLLNELSRSEYVVWSMDDEIASVSPGCLALLGFPPQAAPPKDLEGWLTHVLPEDRLRIRQRISRAGLDPRPPPIVVHLRLADGALRSLESRAAYRLSPEGRVLGFTAVLRDVSDTVLVERELRERSRLLQGLLDDLPDAVLQLDRDLKVLYASPPCQRVLSLTPEQLLGLALPAVWPEPGDAQVLTTTLQNAFADGRGGELDLSLGQAAARRYVQIRYTVERGSTADSDCVLALARDVTSLKMAELKARSAVDRFQRMLDSTDFGVVVCDVHERISFANRRLEQMFGYPHGVLLGQPFQMLLTPEALVHQPERMRQRRAGISAVYELSFRRRDDSSIRCRVSAMPLYDENGEFEGSLGLWTDLSEREQAQNRARRLADRLTYLLETVGEGIAFLDPEGRVMFANARLERMLGVSVGALIGQPGPIRLPGLSELVQLKNRTQETQTEVIRGDGGRLPCSVRLRVAFDDAGAVEGVIATLFDSSAERRGRDAIKRLGRLLDTASEGICFSSADDHIAFANRKLEQLLGYEPGELVGLRDEELLPADVRPLNMRRAVDRRAGVGESYEVLLKGKDGRLVPCDINVTPLFDEAGGFEGNLATIVDLSQREQLKQEARSTTEWLEATLSSAGIGSFDVDLNGVAIRTAGLVRELYGEPFSFARWLNAIADEDREAVSRALDQVQHGHPARVEFRQRQEPGQIGPPRWLYGVLNVVSNAEDSVQRVIGTLIDVSALKTLERERSDLHAQISQTQRQESLGLLAGGVAHDFNNLLTSAVGHLELVKLSAGGNAELTEGLELVDQALGQMGALARQLQLYSGKGQTQFKPLDLNATVQGILAILRVSAGKQAELRVALADAPLKLLGDATQLQQIVMNLTINAAEAIGASGGVITVGTALVDFSAVPAALRAQLKPGPHALLTVSDNGPGMPEEVRARIFEPFFSSKSNGRGLGLAVVVGAVKSHHGQILVDSAPGAGTTFRIWLPLTDSELAPATVPAQKSGSRMLKGTILLIDDEDPVRAMVRRALLLKGLKVIEGGDGEQALSLLASHPEVDVLVMDIIMPRLSGVDAYLRLRAEGHRLPVILMSGFAERSLLDRLDHDPPQTLLRKPFKPAELYAVLEQLLRAHPA